MLEPFLQPDVHVVPYTDSAAQRAQNGCSLRASKFERVDKLRFPFRDNPPKETEDEFKKFLKSTSTVLLLKLFPDCDPVNTAHADCCVRKYFTGITLLNSAEHSLHLDANDEGPTVIYNECSEEC